MFGRLYSLWIELKASLWFVPGIMITISVLAAVGLIEYDAVTGSKWKKEYPFLFGVGADGSRGMLTAIASSMLTVATLAFTLTISAITQASAQFTPRIFRNFLRDRTNQFVLGYFVSVFAYCLVILRTIRGGEEGVFVPAISIFIGLLLAFGGIVVLIYFIHHIASSLQITNIIGEIVDETKDSIASMFPEKMGEPAAENDEPETPGGKELAENEIDWVAIPSFSSGHIQFVDAEGMINFAEEQDILIRMEAAIGEFVGTGATLASVTGPNIGKENGKEVSELADEINDLFSYSRHRAIDQDIGFGLRQLVDIALKALSPGVNDTTTATNCIDNIGELIAEIGGRRIPDPVRMRDGKIRVIAKAPDFEAYVKTGFEQIRISGRANIAVFLHLAAAFDLLATRTNAVDRLEVIERQLALLGEYASMTLSTNDEKLQIINRIDRARGRIKEKKDVA